MTSLQEAVAAGASGDELLGHEIPSTYLTAHLSREDERIFEDAVDKDVRQSLRVGEVPMPKLAPDEVRLAVMASSINYNTVWSAMFEPIPTFRFLEALGRRGGWVARHAHQHHMVGSHASALAVA